MAATQLVGGYHAIALPLEHSAFRRYIYAKKHHVKESESSESLLAADRTAYFVNLPAAADDAWLRACLEPAVGSIQHIVTGGIKASNSGGSSTSDASDPLVAKTAHVVFKSKDALKKVLKVAQLSVPSNDDSDNSSSSAVTGLQAYINMYRANKPGLAAVKAIADAYMSKFDADEEEVCAACAVSLTDSCKCLYLLASGLQTACAVVCSHGNRTFASAKSSRHRSTTTASRPS